MLGRLMGWNARRDVLILVVQGRGDASEVERLDG